MDRHYSFISIWLQLELCAMAVLLTKGEIRCYCDAPHCVATGYMCKSPLNACFTKVVDPHIMNSPLTHGCLDLVATSAGVCLNRPAEDLAAGPSMIQCCHDDMCNYRGVHDLAHTKGEYYDHGNRHRLDNSRHLITKVQDLASAREVWFRAAVIAVPVAGGLILALLVVLALRMLRSENHHLRTQRHQTLAHLQRSFQTHHCTTKKGPPSTKLSTGHAAPELSARPDSSCPVCDKMHVPVLGSDGFLSLVHWGTYRGFEKQEFI